LVDTKILGREAGGSSTFARVAHPSILIEDNNTSSSYLPNHHILVNKIAVRLQ